MANGAAEEGKGAMMSVTIPAWDGPGTGFTIIETVSYVDTVEVIVRFPLPNGLLSKLRKRAGKRMTVRDATRPDRANPATTHAYGKTIAIAQPTREELALIVRLCGNSYLVHRVDVACDFHHATAGEAANCGRYLERHGWQKWRAKTRKRNATSNVSYWAVDASVTRNIALYYDRPSRKNEEPCTHWEMRFVTADACRRAGLSDLNTLRRGINALALLKHQAGLRQLDRDRFFKATEETARLTKRKYRRGLEKKTIAEVQRRVHGFIFAALRTRTLHPDEATIHRVAVQEIHDRVPLLRDALVEAGKWEDLAPVIRWLR